MLEKQVPLESVGPFHGHSTVHRQCAANLSARRTLNGNLFTLWRTSFFPLLLVSWSVNDFIKESLMQVFCQKECLSVWAPFTI
jgi:hypothetical protein